MTDRVRFSEFRFLYGQTIRQMGRVILWLPLLIYGFLAFGIALMHYHIFSPAAGPIVAAWVNLIKPDLANLFYHYPVHFEMFPFFFGNARLAVGVITEAFLFGVFIDLMIALYRGQRPALAVSFGHALRRYFSLTVVWAVLIAVLYVVNLYFNDFIENVIGFTLKASPRRQLAASVALRGLTVLIYMPFVFMLPSIMAGAASFGEIIRRALGMFTRHPFVAFGLVLIPYLIGLLPNWAASQSSNIVANFFPELVFYLVVISIAVDVIINFIFLGTSVKFYMDRSD